MINTDFLLLCGVVQDRCSVAQVLARRGPSHSAELAIIINRMQKKLQLRCEFNAACNSSVKLRGAAVLSPQAKTTASRQDIMQRGKFTVVRVN
jgi:hypothetical protein